ncbi:MAG: caspase family protein, partial [Spirochaetales bacterium]|nr:caspase family protein [Spirochaetales bacterium]
MPKLKVLLLFLVIIIHFSVFCQEPDNVPTLTEFVNQNLKVGRQYLVLIAIDSYTDWMPLRNPVKDALEIKEILIEKYYIDEVFELYNRDATKANILKLFNRLQNQLTLHDSLLVFYAGHGHLDKKTNTGFWIPVNAGLDEFEQANWLPNTQIRGIITNFKSMHVCLVSDSCFSGDILNVNRDITPTINNNYFKNAYRLISRQVLTSGSSESVPDISPFAYQLKMSLSKNESPYLDPLMLYQDVRLGVPSSTPLFGSLKDSGHQEGASFILFLKDSQKNQILTGSIKIVSHAKGEIYIDNVFLEYVPVGETIVNEVSSGEHNIRIVYYPEKNSEERRIIIRPDETEDIIFRWKEEIKKPDVSLNQNVPEVNGFFSLGVLFDVSFPVLDIRTIMNTGYNPALSFGYSFGSDWGSVNFNISTGINYYLNP